MLKMLKAFLVFFILFPASVGAQVAASRHYWVQYNLSDGSQTATNSAKASDKDLAAQGRAQIEYTGVTDPTSLAVDITQPTPAIIAAPPVVSVLPQ